MMWSYTVYIARNIGGDLVWWLLVLRPSSLVLLLLGRKEARLVRWSVVVCVQTCMQTIIIII